jgi:hypothetical protein
MVGYVTNKKRKKMSETQKIMIAVVAVFLIGFFMVGVSKEKQSVEQIEAAAKIRNFVAIQEMASQKCPTKIKEITGEQVFFPSETESDKDTYITLKWVGDDAKNGGFKTASCTLKGSLGGISELVIDDKVIIKK